MIGHAEARQIATDWYAGMVSGLYALASTGALVVNGDFSGKPIDFDEDVHYSLDAVNELQALLDGSPRRRVPDHYRDELQALMEYCVFHGMKGERVLGRLPIPEWNAL